MSVYGDGDLWINNAPVDYFLDYWQSWRGTIDYFKIREEESKKVMMAKYKSVEFERLRHAFDMRKRRLAEAIEKNEQQIKTVATSLGGSSIESGEAILKVKTRELAELYKRKLILRIQSYEAFYGTEITHYKTIEKYIKDAKILEKLEQEVKFENLVKLALSSAVGKPMADTTTKKELNKAIKEIVKESNGQLITAPDKGKRGFNIRAGNDMVKIDIHGSNDLINFLFSSNDKYTKKNQISQQKHFSIDKDIDLGSVYTVMDNVLYDKNMNDYKRATIYNVLNSNGEMDAGFTAQYMYMKNSIKNTYADKILKQAGTIGKEDTVLVVNGQLINVYDLLYNEKRRINKKMNLEAMLPPGLKHSGRRSYSLIGRYANQRIRMQLSLQI